MLQKREPEPTDDPIDWFALLASGIGSALVYVGIGGLAGNDVHDPLASGPLVAGIAIYAALIVAEARKRRPLVPVRKLATSLALVGTIATWTAAPRSRGTGFAFWPEFLTAIASGYVFGRIVTTKWVVVSGAVGLGFIALAAARALVGRAIALLNLFRLTGGFVSAPGVEHTIGSRAQAHLHALDSSLSAHLGGGVVRAFVTGRALPYAEPLDALKHALAPAIDDAYVIVLLLALAGIVAIAGLLVATHVKLRAPDLQRFDDGKPALDAPAIA